MNKKTELLLPEPAKLALVTGGKEPPDINWLSTFNQGDAFLARPRHGPSDPRTLQKTPNTDLDLFEFHVIFKSDKAFRLLCRIKDNEDSKNSWVDPLRFSRDFELFEVLPRIEYE